MIVGCGDIGLRIATQLLEQSHRPEQVSGLVNSKQSVERCAKLGLAAHRFDLDNLQTDLSVCDSAELYYTVAPPSQGVRDHRSEAILTHFDAQKILPNKVVLISTTGVYGNTQGEWVDESSATQPQTERGKRRLDSEHQWLRWSAQPSVPVVILRVPGIYAYSRLPRQRLEKRTPVVFAQECGYSNRVHADDLAHIACVAMANANSGQVYNASDGKPGKITEYLQAAANVLNLEPLPEISMQQAQQELSAGMLSYLNESRKISNRKLLRELPVSLRYTDFRQGIKY